MPKGSGGKQTTRDIFQIGFSAARNENYSKAKANLESARSKKLFLAYVVLAKLYLEKKLKPTDESRECVDEEYILKALEILEEAFRAKPLAKEDVTTYKTSLSKPLSELLLKNPKMQTPEIIRRARYCYAKITLLAEPYRTDIYHQLIISAREGHEAALTEVKSTFGNKIQQVIGNNLQLYAFSEIISIFQNNEATEMNNELAVTLLKSIVNRSVNKDDLIEIGSTTPSPQKTDAIEKVKATDLKPDKSLLYIFYHRVLLQTKNPELISEAFTFINENFSDTLADEAILIHVRTLLPTQNLVLLSTVVRFLINAKQLQDAHRLLDDHWELVATNAEILLTYKSLCQQLKITDKSMLIDQVEDFQAQSKEIKALCKKLTEMSAAIKGADVLNQAFIDLLNQVAKQAAHANEIALGALKTLADEEDAIPEIILAYYEAKKAVQESAAVNQKNSKASTKKEAEETEKYGKKARERFESELKTNRQKDITFRVAMLRYHGRLFEINTSLARSLFKRALEQSIPEAFYWYSKMCFYGEAGHVDIEEAYKVLNRLGDNLTSDGHYLLGEYFYIHFLKYKDANPEVPNPFLEKCINSYLFAIKSNHYEALVSLFILHYYDNEALASTNFQKIMQLNIPIVGRFSTMLSGKASSIPTEQVLDESAFLKAKDELLKYDNPTLLLKLCHTSYHQSVVNELTAFYKRLSNGVLKLISTLCYEANRHAWDEDVCKLLRDVISSIDPTFTHYSRNEFEKYLETNEIRQKEYFDECLSDDSDDEDEKRYQSSAKQNTADHAVTKSIVEKIEASFLEKLKALRKLKQVDDTKYKELEEVYKSLAPETVATSYRASSHSVHVESDLQTLNNFSAQGRIPDALPLISTRFCVVQTRGLHFKTTQWNQPQRREYRQLAVHPDHPLIGKPIYSAAVYDRAGIKQLFNHDEISNLRLLKIARYINYLLLEVSRSDVLCPTDKNGSFPVSLYGFRFQNFGHQLQQLYSNDYDVFHTFISDASRNKSQFGQGFFVSPRNPMVSSGDVQSTHSSRYAYGSKPYAGHKHERLQPKYQSDGRCLRPYSGAVLVTFHPVEDYARNDHHHVVSLNLSGKIVIDDRIIHERECTFFSYIDENRLKFVHIAKFPSFHHQKYLKVFYHKYGLTPQLYKEFKDLISETAPHDNKRKLAILLLGEYLCAYQTMFLMHYATTRADRDKLIPIFRDKYGNFSLKPSYDISPSPNGDADQLRLRRTYTHFLRGDNKFVPDQEVLSSKRSCSDSRSQSADPSESSNSTSSSSSSSSTPKRPASTPSHHLHHSKRNKDEDRECSSDDDQNDETEDSLTSARQRACM